MRGGISRHHSNRLLDSYTIHIPRLIHDIQFAVDIFAKGGQIPGMGV
jgi:hypothetical protein